MEKVKTTLGSVALLAVMAVIVIGTAFGAGICNVSDMMPGKTLGPDGPVCKVLPGDPPGCMGVYLEATFPPYPVCKNDAKGLRSCRMDTVDETYQITTKQCVRNVFSGDCLLGFTETRNEVRKFYHLHPDGEPCPKPTPESEE